MANRQFAELADRFVLLVDDTNDGISDFAKSYEIRNNCTGFVLLDASGDEIGRIVSHGKEAFDETMLARIDEIVREYVYDMDDLYGFVLTMSKKTEGEVRREFEHQVAQLSNEDYLVRDRATKSIVNMGAPAYPLILSAQSQDVEVQARLHGIVARMRPLLAMARHHDLNRDPAYLASHAAEQSCAMNRLKEILPEDADFTDVAKWWRENTDKYQWDDTLGRYVPRD